MPAGNPDAYQGMPQLGGPQSYLPNMLQQRHQLMRYLMARMQQQQMMQQGPQMTNPIGQAAGNALGRVAGQDVGQHAINALQQVGAQY